MRYFKGFTDVCAGFGIFAALMFLFREFMSYMPKDVESTLDKLKLFFTYEPKRDYFLYLPLIGLLFLSLVVSLVARRIPALSVGISALPVAWIFSMLASEKLYERPMAYVILTLFHFFGNLLFCIVTDREDRGRRSAWGTDAVGAITAGLCIFLMERGKALTSVTSAEHLKYFDRAIYYRLEDADFTVFRTLAILFAVTVVLRLLLRDVYWLDAVLALIPSVCAVYLWTVGKIPYYGSMVVSLAAIYALARIAIMLTCQPKYAYDSDS